MLVPWWLRTLAWHDASPQDRSLVDLTAGTLPWALSWQVMHWPEGMSMPLWQLGAVGPVAGVALGRRGDGAVVTAGAVVQRDRLRGAVVVAVGVVVAGGAGPEGLVVGVVAGGARRLGDGRAGVVLDLRVAARIGARLDARVA